MERNKAKEAGRKKTIRDKANALKEKPSRKAPAKEVIKQAGRYHAIEAARKQLIEAQQAIAPDQEQQPYTAVDKVEDYAGSIVHELVLTPVSALERGRLAAKKNAFHHETQKESAVSPTKPTPKQLMRREAVKEYKRKHQAEKHNSFHHETQFEPDEAEKSAKRAKEQMRRSYVRKVREQTDYPTTEKDAAEHPFSQGTSARNPKRRDEIAPAQYKTSTATQPNTAQSTGQRQTALPRNASTVSTSKAQLVKEQGRRYARNQAIQEIKTNTAKSLSGKAAKTSGDFFKKLGAAITKAVTPSRETMIYAAGALVLIIIPFVVIMGVASMLTGTGDGRSAYVPVSAEVEAYRPLIRLYAAQHGIPEYEDLIAAVMMQESGGQGTDPMQCSECGFNTRYPHYPNGITDPEYSIDVGIQNLADCMHLSGVESPIDLDHISLALQGYNYGSGYIGWALANYGGYSELNAIEFSDMMAARSGSAGYGDKAYVSHVLRYYPIGRSFMGEGNAAMVAVAQAEIGNSGGMKYCEWYGYNYRVEWCAIFVSWCADQCGYLDAGVLPKMEGVRPYVDWFIERAQWQGRDYEPSQGDIIFFDWESDGLADHVGIVEKVENGLIYTVEGNTGDVCAERRYTLRAVSIYGYGLPLY